MSARKSKIKQNINTENARWITRPARTWQPAKRISATNNIVYEFNPFGNVENNDISKGFNNSQNSINSCGLFNGLKVSTISKSTTNDKKHIAKDAKARSIVTLPKLSSSSNNSTNIFEKNEKVMNVCENQASLPCILKRTDLTKNKTISKESDKKWKIASAKLNYIDRDVKKVKTNWEQFQKHYDRRKERYNFNPRMKKLYEVLENTACDRNKIKENVDSTNDQNILSKNSKFSKNSKIIDQSDVEHSKNMLFPKQDQLAIVKSTTTSIDLSSRGLKEDIVGNEKRNIVEQQPLFTEKRLQNINDILTYESNLLNPHKNYSLNNKTSRKVKTEIDKYLEKYTTNFDKLNTIEQKNVTIKVMKSQNDIQENFNENLNYSYCVSEENINNFEKDGIETSLNNNDFGENKESANETKNIDTKSVEIFDEFNEKLSKENTFVKIDCNDLNLPKNVLDKVLQSEYLKKELFSLYPM
ncbi:putative uncharacterized protein DDB_G0289263 [Polistes fuscatus]|uniref:putative uncharacterized protein DDB_G0289263 n=1 Tax=Polistes fuscatus TaxID=30207 RepID=UPI001CA8A76F|nr:putative uncharacterized protein DDB_G0289263 [Polistes fuscatus]XP_043503011.1 putative uncharacterized protein DDB_G0289263 [Polistes fuscatus]